MSTYGQQFLALIKRCSVPRYHGGGGERAAFRGAFKRFTREVTGDKTGTTESRV